MSHLCTNCHSVHLIRTSKDILVTGCTPPEIVPAVKGWHCPDCGAVMFCNEDKSSSKVGNNHSLASAFFKQAAFIRAVRIKLSLTLQQAQATFGGEEGSFNKYEQMEAIPPKAIVLLLRILEKHPDLLPEIRASE